jgi:hypothetical protein
LYIGLAYWPTGQLAIQQAAGVRLYLASVR